ncbi:unnamed protein product [Peniophora sp. CBMAI 1063]|nr:unnamed protein product [Peniophora sp. CBMAI 1063]
MQSLPPPAPQPLPHSLYGSSQQRPAADCFAPGFRPDDAFDPHTYACTVIGSSSPLSGTSSLDNRSSHYEAAGGAALHFKKSFYRCCGVTWNNWLEYMEHGDNVHAMIIIPNDGDASASLERLPRLDIQALAFPGQPQDLRYESGSATYDSSSPKVGMRPDDTPFFVTLQPPLQALPQVQASTSYELHDPLPRLMAQARSADADCEPLLPLASNDVQSTYTSRTGPHATSHDLLSPRGSTSAIVAPLDRPGATQAELKSETPLAPLLFTSIPLKQCAITSDATPHPQNNSEDELKLNVVSRAARSASTSGTRRSLSPNGIIHQDASEASDASSATSVTPCSGSPLLSAKPFRCPKLHCNKSYMRSAGLKYHILQGSCSHGPTRDFQTVQALLAEKGVAEDGALSESDRHEVKRELLRRLRPFECSVGNCTRRYKNMNGLRYHYRHSRHGAEGMRLLASGDHPCLQRHTSRGRQAAQSAAQAALSATDAADP